MNGLTSEEKNAWVVNLLIACPLGRVMDSCPAKLARELTFSDRVNFVRVMEEIQIDQIIAHHWNCRCQREESLSGLNR
jgi:hypothetical protein